MARVPQATDSRIGRPGSPVESFLAGTTSSVQELRQLGQDALPGGRKRPGVNLVPFTGVGANKYSLS